MLGARTPRGARRTLVGLGVALAITAIASIENRFGQLALGATGAAVIAVALVPRPRLHLAAAHLLAAQACVGAVVDIRVLFRPNLVVDGQVVRDSDAHAMAVATFGTDASWAVWTWAAIWIAWSLALLFLVLAWVRRATAAPPSAPGPRPEDSAPGSPLPAPATDPR